jgi:hypothetical protein
MYASVTLLALSTVVISSNAAEMPSWQSDYTTARKLGEGERKPVVVVFGSGKAGWNKLSKEGDLGKEVNLYLATHYVCLYLDLRNEAAQELASALEVTLATGIVITDGTGQVQAFRHQGDLDNVTLFRHLQRYSDSERLVRTTESNPESSPEPRPSYYYPVETRPAMFFGGFGGGGRSC